jgi:hypothetical protein
MRYRHSRRDHYGLTGWGRLVCGYGVVIVVSRFRLGKEGNEERKRKERRKKIGKEEVCELKQRFNKKGKKGSEEEIFMEF